MSEVILNKSSYINNKKMTAKIQNGRRQSELCASYLGYVRVCLSDSKWWHKQLMYLCLWLYNFIDGMQTQIPIGQ